MNAEELKIKMIKSCTLFNLGMTIPEIAEKLDLSDVQVNYFITASL